MTDERHQGCANIETFSVSLLLAGSMGREEYEEARAVIAGAASGAVEHDSYKSGIWTLDQARRFVVADAIKGWIEDRLFESDLDIPAPGQDLMRDAFGRVDWEELASHVLSETGEGVSTT